MLNILQRIALQNYFDFEIILDYKTITQRLYSRHPLQSNCFTRRRVLLVQGSGSTDDLNLFIGLWQFALEYVFTDLFPKGGLVSYLILFFLDRIG